MKLYPFDEVVQAAEAKMADGGDASNKAKMADGSGASAIST